MLGNTYINIRLVKIVFVTFSVWFILYVLAQISHIDQAGYLHLNLNFQRSYTWISETKLFLYKTYP